MSLFIVLPLSFIEFLKITINLQTTAAFIVHCLPFFLNISQSVVFILFYIILRTLLQKSFGIVALMFAPSSHSCLFHLSLRFLLCSLKSIYFSNLLTYYFVYAFFPRLIHHLSRYLHSFIPPLSCGILAVSLRIEQRSGSTKP